MEEILLRLVVCPITYKVLDNPKGGWPWDFWTINSIKPCFNKFFLLSPIHGASNLAVSKQFQDLSWLGLQEKNMENDELPTQTMPSHTILYEWLNFMVNVGNLYHSDGC